MTVGRTLEEAVAAHETVEHAARILHLASQLGGARRLTAEDRGELRELRARMLGKRNS